MKVSVIGTGAMGSIYASFFAKNGFDVPVQSGKIMAYPGMPRTWGITLRSHF